jgi:hypothetical protein
VTLTAVPGGNSTFTGWGGQCSGTGSCQLLMFSTRSVTATFTATSTEGGNPAATNYTGLWWNRLESGWGVNFSHQGNLLFATLFTYDQEGTPMWLVMSSGQLQTDGRTFSGDLYATRGPAFNAIPFSPSDVHVERVGSMSVAFANATSAVLAYNVSGVGVTKAIEPQVYGTRRATCRPSTAGTRAGLTNYQDLWWNPLESGWGINITHQDDTIFATLFDYDLSGHGAWYVMSAGVRLADGSYTGDLYRTAGSGFASVPFSLGNVTQVGSMQLRFQDGVTGVLAYSINGAAVTKTIVRQVFAAPGPECSS